MKTIPRPALVEMLFKHFSCIDVHDHLRQGSLCLEESWRTQLWWHRIFATMLGVIFTDCYFAYKYKQTQLHREPKSFTKFLDELAFKLIHNSFLGNGPLTRSATAQMEVNALQGAQEHHLAELSDLEYYEGIRNSNKRARRSCKICKSDAAFYCVACSNISMEGEKLLGVFTLCSAKKTCFAKHICEIIST